MWRFDVTRDEWESLFKVLEVVRGFIFYRPVQVDALLMQEAAAGSLFGCVLPLELSLGLGGGAAVGEPLSSVDRSESLHLGSVQVSAPLPVPLASRACVRV